MDLQQLRYVAALAQERHFQKAARSLGVTQPTLSQQVKKLEDELGEALFERSSRHVALTPAGERFLPYVLSSLDAIKVGVETLRSGGGDVAGPIRVGFLPTIGPYLIPGMMKRLKQHAPGLKVELHEETAPRLASRVREGRLDLAVLSLPFREAGLATRALGSEALLLAVAKDHALAKGKTVAPKSLDGERLLVLQEGHCFRNQSLAFCKGVKTQPQVVFQGSGLASVLRMAAAGEGITLVPKMAAEGRSNPDVKFLPFTGVQPTRDIGVAWRSSASLTQKEHLIMREVENLLA